MEIDVRYKILKTLTKRVCYKNNSVKSKWVWNCFWSTFSYIRTEYCMEICSVNLCTLASIIIVLLHISFFEILFIHTSFIPTPSLIKFQCFKFPTPNFFSVFLTFSSKLNFRNVNQVLYKLRLKCWIERETELPFLFFGRKNNFC